MIAAAAVVLFRPHGGKSLVVDEFGIDKAKFPYVLWKNFSSEYRTIIAEVIDYRTLRGTDGRILLLSGVIEPIDEAKTVAFLKKNVLGKEVTVLICSLQTNYSGLVHSVVFYGKPVRCLNRVLYEKGLVDVIIKNRFFKKELWFNAETD